MWSIPQNGSRDKINFNDLNILQFFESSFFDIQQCAALTQTHTENRIKKKRNPRIPLVRYNIPMVCTPEKKAKNITQENKGANKQQ